MVAKAKKIIIASSQEDLSQMESLLSQQGCDVQMCTDGAKALELALTTAPDLLFVDTRVPVLAAPKLAQILRSNPRTEAVPMFFVGLEGEDIAGFRRHRDRFIQRPFNPEQLLADILGYFRRFDQTKQVSRQEKDFEGNLNRISLVDLLQVLSLNQRDGILSLSRGRQKGVIHLLDGCVIHAQVAQILGEKAFYRLLTWDEGNFSFSPGHVDVEASINLPMDHLLIEGLRQNDELKQQADVLPPLDAFLVLKVPRSRLPRGLRPITQEILVLLDYYQSCRDVVDHCPRPDFEVLQVLKVLLDKGLIEKRLPSDLGVSALVPLLSSEEVIAVKDRLGQRGTLLERASAKLILLARSSEDVRRFVQALQGIGEFEPSSEYLVEDKGLPLGDIGRLEVAETFYLRLFALPAMPEAAPLWEPFCRRLFGVAALSSGDAMKDAERYFRSRAHVEVVEIALDKTSSGGRSALALGGRKGLRKILQKFLVSFQQQPAIKDMS